MARKKKGNADTHAPVHTDVTRRTIYTYQPIKKISVSDFRSSLRLDGHCSTTIVRITTICIQSNCYLSQCVASRCFGVSFSSFLLTVTFRSFP